MIICYTVPEIQQVTDVILIFRFGLFFAFTPPPPPPPPPPAPNNPKNKNFKKMKKIPGDITILHMHTINYDHMMYSS